MLGNLKVFGPYLGVSFSYTHDKFSGFEGKFGFYLMNFEDLLNLWRSCFLPSGIAKNSLEEIGIKKPLSAHSLKNHAKKPTKKRDLSSEPSLSCNEVQNIYYNLSIQVLCLT